MLWPKTSRLRSLLMRWFDLQTGEFARYLWEKNMNQMDDIHRLENSLLMANSTIDTLRQQVEVCKKEHWSNVLDLASDYLKSTKQASRTI